MTDEYAPLTFEQITSLISAGRVDAASEHIERDLTGSERTLALERVVKVYRENIQQARKLTSANQGYELPILLATFQEYRDIGTVEEIRAIQEENTTLSIENTGLRKMLNQYEEFGSPSEVDVRINGS